MEKTKHTVKVAGFSFKVVSEDSDMSDEQKKEYKTLMERQYQNMNYKIVNEEIDEDRASSILINDLRKGKLGKILFI